MNYLAHLYLSPDDEYIRLGNLMGDFVKGNKGYFQSLPTSVQQGVLLHRAIDKFTDQHQDVYQLKRLLSPERRRFSGIISDVVFDHLLAKNWSKFSTDSLAEFAIQQHQLLTKHQKLMPEKMQIMTSRMIAGHWLEGYQLPESIDGALNGISRRIRFNNNLLNAYQEVSPQLEQYQQVFARFFPQLQAASTGFIAQYC